VSGCIEWEGRRSPDGYGRTMDDGRERPAHQVVWERHTGQRVPRGMVVMHRCDNPPCVNPEHLRLGTHADNQHDKVAKGRQATGVNHGRAVLDPPQVVDIRELAAKGYTNHYLGKLYGVDHGTIRAIVIRRTWRNVDVGGKPLGKHGEGPEAVTFGTSVTLDNDRENCGAERDRTAGLLNAISRTPEKSR
jgi:HNH endonuclease